MNTTEVKGNWNEKKGKLKQEFEVFKPNIILIMKKVLLVLTMVMAVLVVNGQATKTTVTKDKVATETLKAADLQKDITDNIAKDFVGYTITGATKVTVNGTVKYEVVVTNGTATETLVYDKDGKYLHKMVPKTEVKETKVVKTTTTTTTKKK
jgi:hypothetical protein